MIRSWFKKVTFNWIELNWMIWANRSQKGVISLKKIKFIVCIWLFSPYLCPRESCTCHSSLSFKKKSNVALDKRVPWANRFHHSLQKSSHEWFLPIAHDMLFSQANRSFALALTKNKQFALKTNEQIPNPVNCTLLWNMEGFFNSQPLL